MTKLEHKSNLKLLKSTNQKVSKSDSLQVTNLHPTESKIGVILVQLGTPDEPTPKAVRRYLKEFLSDRHVVDVNPILWFFILNFIILRTRPKKSAALYQRLFDTYGPVLRIYTKSLTEKISQEFAIEQNNMIIRYGMRYGNPSLKSVLREMIDQDKCTNFLIVPLFPQHSNTTTGSINDLVMKEISKLRDKPTIRFMPTYHQSPGYIKSICHLLEECLKDRKNSPDKILLSYHGIPKRYAKMGDPYKKHCEETTELIKQQLNFPQDNILHTYQSRFGKEPWLQPYTDETLISLAQLGMKDVMIACPAFTMDCLETLDEIAVENQKLFLHHGGERLQLVSCLNDDDFWVKNLKQLIENELKGWI